MIVDERLENIYLDGHFMSTYDDISFYSKKGFFHSYLKLSQR
jgi:hypothetical protein